MANLLDLPPEIIQHIFMLLTAPLHSRGAHIEKPLLKLPGSAKRASTTLASLCPQLWHLGRRSFFTDIYIDFNRERSHLDLDNDKIAQLLIIMDQSPEVAAMMTNLQLLDVQASACCRHPETFFWQFPSAEETDIRLNSLQYIRFFSLNGEPRRVPLGEVYRLFSLAPNLNTVHLQRVNDMGDKFDLSNISRLGLTGIHIHMPQLAAIIKSCKALREFRFDDQDKIHGISIKAIIDALRERHKGTLEILDLGDDHIGPRNTSNLVGSLVDFEVLEKVTFALKAMGKGSTSALRTLPTSLKVLHVSNFIEKEDGKEFKWLGHAVRRGLYSMRGEISLDVIETSRLAEKKCEQADSVRYCFTKLLNAGVKCRLEDYGYLVEHFRKTVERKGGLPVEDYLTDEDWDESFSEWAFDDDMDSLWDSDMDGPMDGLSDLDWDSDSTDSPQKIRKEELKRKKKERDAWLRTPAAKWFWIGDGYEEF
uniref:F-box domain-containing protein n=1 Tax=Colletotrichum fructicola (strain Nara gc5) TaxID=1213859 RepID=L2FH62_COLFN